MDEPIWQPWTKEDVEALLDEDVATLSPDDSASFTSVKVAPRPLARESGAEDQPPTHWIVAERAGKAIYWDSTEEEFGVGRLRDGVLTERKNYEELQWAVDELFAESGRRPSGDAAPTKRESW